MTSVADDLRRETRADLMRMTAEQRMALALDLGDDDLAGYSGMHGVAIEAARAIVRRSRTVGRVPSRAHDAGPT